MQIVVGYAVVPGSCSAVAPLPANAHCRVIEVGNFVVFDNVVRACLQKNACTSVENTTARVNVIVLDDRVARLSTCPHTPCTQIIQVTVGELMTGR